MAGTPLHRVTSISELHRNGGLPRPVHPLISVINIEDLHFPAENQSMTITLDFYSIALKRPCQNKFKYGQQQYDFQEGVMFFMAPGQVFTRDFTPEKHDIAGWVLYIHPDFFWNTPLAKGIKQYDFFDYSVNEALFLSEKEEVTIIHIMHRSDKLSEQGLPTVQYVAEQLNLSPNYLSTLLKDLTGRNTQQHIQDKMIEKAKERISTTQLSVSEISYELGFDHPQSFSRLFKAKTGLSPLEFRQSFN